MFLKCTQGVIASPFFFCGGAGALTMFHAVKVQPLVLGSWGSMCEFQFIINLWVFSMQLFIMKHSSPQRLRDFLSRYDENGSTGTRCVGGDFGSANKMAEKSEGSKLAQLKKAMGKDLIKTYWG